MNIGQGPPKTPNSKMTRMFLNDWYMSWVHTVQVESSGTGGVERDKGGSFYICKPPEMSVAMGMASELEEFPLSFRI